jgi:hypothetical protein
MAEQRSTLTASARVGVRNHGRGGRKPAARAKLIRAENVPSISSSCVPKFAFINAAAAATARPRGSAAVGSICRRHLPAF